MSELVLVERDGPIAVVTLNNPALRNPISDIDMIEALTARLEEVDRDPDIRCVILAAAGPTFSSGGNLTKIGQPGELGGGSPVETPAGYKAGIQRIPILFEKMEVPVIAAVQGAAVGAGCDLACMCDIRIAADTARFAESFVKLGLIPGDGGAWLLPRVVGFSKACEMAFTGEFIDAADALACGLVSRVVPEAELLDAARDLANRIAANPPHAVRMAKRLMHQARHQRLDEHLETAAAYQALAHTTADHREAIAAFRDKRRPQFTGL
ncbi:crotonase/enoyl-CoA hydratase family protein [Sphingobium aquiterrae]|uniref:crotonase/enoyl-CoA hydratase family protein n=1 Tax=Sphingobium aquiterrae TaxID=2038656 RepID=UPI003017FC0D